MNYNFDINFDAKTPNDLSIISDEKLLELKEYYDSMSWSRSNEPDPKLQLVFFNNQARINMEIKRRKQTLDIDLDPDKR